MFCGSNDALHYEINAHQEIRAVVVGKQLFRNAACEWIFHRIQFDHRFIKTAFIKG